MWRVTLGTLHHCMAASGDCPGSTASATAPAGVTVTFKADTVGGGLKFVPRECPYIVLKSNGMKTEKDCPQSIDDCIAKCGWWDIEYGQGNWHKNVTATISGNTVTVSPPTDAVRACGYGSLPTLYAMASLSLSSLCNVLFWPLAISAMLLSLSSPSL